MEAAAAVPAVVAAEPWRGLVVVRCARFACILLATACGTRCAARWPSGKRKGAPRFPPCAACVEGAAVVASLGRGGWRPPPDSAPADVLDARQRAGRDRWLRSFPAYAEPQAVDRDPVLDVAASTPDDRGEPADSG
jgi:hypothetical protein